MCGQYGEPVNSSVKWEVFRVVKDQSLTTLNTPNAFRHPPHFTDAEWGPIATTIHCTLVGADSSFLLHIHFDPLVCFYLMISYHLY
jgi:hypothetical protein